MEQHSFKKGDWVFIINQSGGQFFIEGKGQVVKPLDSEERYVVRLKYREGWEQTERFVDPAVQDDPYDFVSRLNAVRHAQA